MQRPSHRAEPFTREQLEKNRLFLNHSMRFRVTETSPKPVEPDLVHVTLVGDVDYKHLAVAISDFTSWLPFEIATSHSGISDPEKRDIVKLGFRYSGQARDRDHFENNLRNLFAEHFELASSNELKSNSTGDFS